MSAPTGDSKLIAELNELLGRELGRNQYGDPYFTWRWSEDLYWPAFATGRKLIKETKVLTPIIGAPKDTHDYDEAYDAAADTWDSDFGGQSGKCVHCSEPESDLAHNVYSIMQTSEPEYDRDRQMRARDTWVVCKWLTPWELILGPREGSIMHGEQGKSAKEPSQAALIAAWNRQAPGAVFPARGWLVPTDASLPRIADGVRTPNRTDTDWFILQVKWQTSRPFAEVEQDMMDQEDARSRKQEMLIGEEAADMWSAFLNPKPGTRGRGSGGGFISFPWTKKDRLR